MQKKLFREYVDPSLQESLDEWSKDEEADDNVVKDAKNLRVLLVNTEGYNVLVAVAPSNFEELENPIFIGLVLAFQDQRIRETKKKEESQWRIKASPFGMNTYEKGWVQSEEELDNAIASFLRIHDKNPFITSVVPNEGPNPE